MAENFMLLLVEILDTGETRSDGSLVSTRRKVTQANRPRVFKAVKCSLSSFKDSVQ